MDQCTGCGYKLDDAFEKCKAVDCVHHENWYAKKMQDENDRLKKQLGHCYGRMHDALMEIGDNQKVRFILQEELNNR
jgi:hypothetical protein